MVKYKVVIFTVLFVFFLLFSFTPTIFEISQASKLGDIRREFIWEHNYYWPDFNLYLSKIRQGKEGNWIAIERYTSEPHKASLIQEFYVVLGQLGRAVGVSPNVAYQIGRILLAPILLFIVMKFSLRYFSSIFWQVLGFLIVLVSGSFPKIAALPDGTLEISRYMGWWSNIDALQRITFIPHILFGQVVSFYLLYELTAKGYKPTAKKLAVLILLGNLAGLVFPPSLITLNSVLFLYILIRRQSEKFVSRRFSNWYLLIFIVGTVPSLLYLFFITQIPPWSALVQFHRDHPMMIPFWEYFLGTGPITILALGGTVLVIIKKQIRFIPLILWILITIVYAILFTFMKEQSPLRFTQTGLFIPLGILGTYFLESIWRKFSKGKIPKETILETPLSVEKFVSEGFSIAKSSFILFVVLYIASSLFMMKNSMDWQFTFISQRVAATVPEVPYPPQTMYPLTSWFDAIRWLRNNTKRDDVVLAEITAGNYIPAYAGNTVYFGQSNTVDYERKQGEVQEFFKGQMSGTRSAHFLQNGRIRYVFFSIQEKKLHGGKDLTASYPFLKEVFRNEIVTIYQVI